MNELVHIDNHQVVTDSRSVAENFGKRHNDVTEVIRKLLATEKSVTNKAERDCSRTRNASFVAARRYYLP